MWFQIVSYLKFLAKSTNEHGVHSPYVFKYVTECLYSKKKLHKKSSINVLLKTLAYFNCESIYIKNKPEIEELVKQNLYGIQLDKKMIDLLFVDGLDAASFQKMLSEGKFHNDSLILVDAIHSDRKNLEQWNHLVALPEITVSIDMYHCGLISIRREQVKEHFTIRI